jgi:hypothetical protein
VVLQKLYMTVSPAARCLAWRRPASRFAVTAAPVFAAYFGLAAAMVGIRMTYDTERYSFFMLLMVCSFSIQRCRELDCLMPRRCAGAFVRTAGGGNS